MALAGSQFSYVDEMQKSKVAHSWATASDVEECRCPLCDSDSKALIHAEQDGLRVVRCTDCQLIYVSPRLREPESLYFGDEQKYLSEIRLILEGKAPSHRDPNYQEHVRMIAQFQPTGRFLDVGSNMGMFLRNAVGRGWELFGVEPSPALSKIARERFHLNVKTAFLHEANYPSGFFDVVVMTDVFEHIKEPKALLAEIHRILAANGIVYINVPNGRFNVLKLKLATLFGRKANYDIFDSYEHVVHYTHETLVRMARECGFRPEAVRVGLPVQVPVWHLYVGDYYQYPSPWFMDPVHHTLRTLFHRFSLVEYFLRGNRIGWLAPNITLVARKA